MDQIFLHGFSVSPHVRTARMVFHEKQVPIGLVEMSLDDVHTAAYARINPFRKMPAMVCGDHIRFETPALLVYADGIGTGPRLQPDDPLELAKMWQFIGVAQNYLFPTGVLQLWFQNIAAGLFGLERDAEISDAAAALTAEHLLFLESELVDGYLAGGALSLADFYCGAMVDYVARTRDGRTVISKLPLVTSWLNSLRLRPSFAASLSPALEGKDQP